MLTIRVREEASIKKTKKNAPFGRKSSSFDEIYDFLFDVLGASVQGDGEDCLDLALLEQLVAEYQTAGLLLAEHRQEGQQLSTRTSHSPVTPTHPQTNPTVNHSLSM